VQLLGGIAMPFAGGTDANTHLIERRDLQPMDAQVIASIDVEVKRKRMSKLVHEY